MNRLQDQLCAAVTAAMNRQPVKIPEAGILFWDVFLDLSRTRTWHAAGPHAISYGEIDAYCRLMRMPLEPRHVGILRAMDAAWMEGSRSRDKREDGKTLPPVSSHPINTAVFDVMFR